MKLESKWYWRLIKVVTAPVWVPSLFVLLIIIMLVDFIGWLVELPIRYIITGKTDTFFGNCWNG